MDNIVHIAIQPAENRTALEDIRTIPDGSVDTLIIDNVLDDVKYEERNRVLVALLQKVKYGGRIQLYGKDYIALSCAILTKEIIEEGKVNQALFGLASISTIENAIQLIEAASFIITHKTITNGTHEYYVEATREESGHIL